MSCFQTGRSQLRRYKAKKLLVSEGEASQPKAKSQVLEFWLVREYCDKGSLSVRFLHTVSPCRHALFFRLVLALRCLCCMGLSCSVNATMSDTELLVRSVYVKCLVDLHLQVRLPRQAGRSSRPSKSLNEKVSISRKINKQNTHKHQQAPKLLSSPTSSSPQLCCHASSSLITFI